MKAWRFTLLAILLLASACVPARIETSTVTPINAPPAAIDTATPTALPPTPSPTPLGGGGRLVGTDPLWRGQIVVLNTDSSDAVKINTTWWNTEGAPGYAMQPAWSPDGQKIAFTAYLTLGDGATPTDQQTIERARNSEIFVANQDGTGLMRLTHNDIPDEGPAWSPDGKLIAFSSDDQIYIMNSDGTALTRLTHDDAFDSDPSWSPDGKKIAFSSDMYRRGNSVIFAMNVDGSQMTQLTGYPGSDTEPAWSPDGKRIAFVSDRRITGYDIYVMNADGSGQVSITDAGYEFLSPSWSPDGRMIAYVQYPGDFCLVGSDGGEPVCHFGIERWLSWSRP